MTKYWLVAVLFIASCGARKAVKDAGTAADGSVAETGSGGAGPEGGSGGGGGGRDGDGGRDGGGGGGAGGSSGALGGTSGATGSAGSRAGSDGGIDGGAGIDGGGGIDGGSASCSGMSPGSTMSWVENGVSQCADKVAAMVRASTGLEVFGTQASNVAGLDRSLVLRAPALPGTYFCVAASVDGGPSPPSFFFESVDLVPYTVQSCTITITSDVTSGANVKGTFSAVFNSSTAGTKVIEGGVFDAFVL